MEMAIEALMFNVLTTLIQDLPLWQAMAAGGTCQCPDPLDVGNCIGGYIKSILATTVPPLGPLNILPCPT